MAAIPVYDPGTGSVTYEEQPEVIFAPGSGDSGYNYTRDVLDVLKYGMGIFGENKRFEFDTAKRYELGRGGLTQQGRPIPLFGAQPGGMSAGAVLLAAGAVALVLYLALRK